MDFSVARQNMVDCQIRPNGITDAGLITALGQVEREKFLPVDRRSIAYADQDFSLNDGRFLLDPMTFAKLLQMAAIQPGELVLDIGAASGYTTAVIAQIAQSVIGIEENEQLCETASATLLDLGVTNAAVICSQHCKGLAAEAPFDVIIVNGQIPEISQVLIDQLAPGGRLVAIVGHGFDARVKMVTRIGEKISTREGNHAASPALCGFATPVSQFSF